MTHNNTSKSPDFSLDSEDHSENLEATQGMENNTIGIVKSIVRPRLSHFTHKDSVDSASLSDDFQDSQHVVRRMSIKTRNKYPTKSTEGVITLKKCGYSPEELNCEYKEDQNETIVDSCPFGFVQCAEYSRISRNLQLPSPGYVCTLDPENNGSFSSNDVFKEALSASVAGSPTNVPVEKPSPRKNSIVSNLNGSFDNFLKSPAVKRRSSIHKPYPPGKDRRKSELRRGSGEFFTIDSLLPEYDIKEVDKPYAEVKRWYSELKWHMDKRFAKFSFSPRKARLRISLTSSKKPTQNTKSREPPFRAHYHQPWQKKSGESFARKTSCEPSSYSPQRRSKDLSRNSPRIKLHTSPTPVPRKPRSVHNAGLLGTIDPMGSFIILVHKGYVEDIEALLKLSFLQKMVYESRKREYERSLISGLRQMQKIVKECREILERRQIKLMGERLSKREIEELLNTEYYMEMIPENYHVYISVFNHPLLFS